MRCVFAAADRASGRGRGENEDGERGPGQGAGGEEPPGVAGAAWEASRTPGECRRAGGRDALSEALVRRLEQLVRVPGEKGEREPGVAGQRRGAPWAEKLRRGDAALKGPPRLQQEELAGVAATHAYGAGAETRAPVTGGVPRGPPLAPLSRRRAPQTTMLRQPCRHGSTGALSAGRFKSERSSLRGAVGGSSAAAAGRQQVDEEKVPLRQANLQGRPQECHHQREDNRCAPPSHHQLVPRELRQQYEHCGKQGGARLRQTYGGGTVGDTYR